MMRAWSGVGFVVAILLWSGGARAQTCLVASTGLSFGVYSPLSAASSTITGTVSVTCQATVSVGLSYSIQIGAGGGGSFAARSLLGGPFRLGYQIYINSALSSIWGDGTGGTATVSDGYLLVALGMVTRTYTAYGRIPALQNVGPGAYVDMLMVAVTY